MKYPSLLIAVLIHLSFLVVGFLSQATAQEDIKEEFVNIGLIGVSKLHSLPEQTNSIVFRIRNNTTRTISQIYGWVYMYDKGPNGKGNNFVLMNNPHKGGNIIKGNPHRPGTVSEWSFPLVRAPFIANQEVDYTLRVHTRSIYFSKVEPPSAPIKIE
ncbi:MAG: hypothetical protein HOH38_13060 [Nitrospinaceae bacterium]|nr:hypothetical protein [Nitrospinaceae bacterium]MBT6346242.1 hypothetical protein [Nitrospina sp.]